MAANSLAIPWLVEVGIIAWRDAKNEKRPPIPSELLATFVVFGAFSLFSEKAPGLAATLGWGIVAATFLNFVDPTLNGPVVGSQPSTTPSVTTVAKTTSA